MYIRVISVSAVLFLWACVGAYAADSPSEHFQLNGWFGEYGRPGAQYLNPAGMVESDWTDVSTGVLTTAEGGAERGYFSVVEPFGYNHSLGFTFFNNISPPSILSGEQPYLQRAWQLGWGYRLPCNMIFSHLLAVGANFTFMELDTGVSNGEEGFGIDLGLSLNPVASSRFGHLQLGAVYQGLLISPYTDTTESQEPAYANLITSLYWKSPLWKWEAQASLAIGDVTRRRGGERRFLPEGSITWHYHPHYGVRAGYNRQGYPVLGGIMALGRVGIIPRLTLEADFSHDLLSFRKSEGGGAICLSAHAQLGKMREMRAAGPARHRRLKLEPEDAQQELFRLYQAKKYTLVLYAHSKLSMKYPGYENADTSDLLAANSLEHLGLNIEARRAYLALFRKHQDSGMEPYFVYKLMNLDYKEGKYDEVEKKHRILTNRFPDSEVMPDADYIMGQILYGREDDAGCLHRLEKIPADNGHYAFARYSMGLAAQRQQDVPGAVEAFQDAVSHSPENKDGRELKNNALIRLGQLMREGKSGGPDAALHFFTQVDTASLNFDEALLGMAQARLGMKQYRAAERAVDALLDADRKTCLKGEAFYLKGLLHLTRNDNTEALKRLYQSREMTDAPYISDAVRDLTDKAWDQNRADWKQIEPEYYRCIAGPRIHSGWKNIEKLSGDYQIYMSRKAGYEAFTAEFEKSRHYDKSRIHIHHMAEDLIEEINQRLEKEKEKEKPEEGRNLE